MRETETERDEPNLAPERLIGAREAASSLLDEIGIANYRFDVEPRGQAFEVLVEHARDGEWHTASIHEDGRALLSALRDPAVRAELRERWRARLVG